MYWQRSIEKSTDHPRGMWCRNGIVRATVMERPGAAELLVEVEGTERRAVNYPALTGPARPGDRVLLNTTATELNLGTGGMDFVLHNLDCPPVAPTGAGHVIKLRYTPWQFRVLSCEEEAAGFQNKLHRFRGLGGRPVIIGELHSMLAPAAAVLKHLHPTCRIAYLMTGGGALPLSFSRTVAMLKRKGILAAAITCGQAFGGDYEAVNVYSGLAACHSFVGADMIIITMGPGNAGTGTRLGFSGMEVGENVNRVHALEGTAIVIPRLSFADPRSRHRGISHHTLTALRVAARAPAYLALPRMPAARRWKVWQQLSASPFPNRLNVRVLQTPPLLPLMEGLGLPLPESMGRTYLEDPQFFDAPAAAALLAMTLAAPGRLKGKKGGLKIESALVPLSLPRADHQPSSGRD